MKRWYLLLVIFSFSAPLIGMENERELDDVGYTFSDKKTDGDTVIDIRALIKEGIMQGLKERDQEHEQRENGRFCGLNSWLKHHLYVTTTIQIVGSFASMAGFIVYFFPYSS